MEGDWLTMYHGRRSMGGQGDMSPLLFEVEGTSCVLSPLLSGVDILVMHNCTHCSFCLLVATTYLFIVLWKTPCPPTDLHPWECHRNGHLQNTHHKLKTHESNIMQPGVTLKVTLAIWSTTFEVTTLRWDGNAYIIIVVVIVSSIPWKMSLVS